MADLEEGILRVIAGPEKKSRLLTEKERVVTAYHEMGHALVGHFLPNADPVPCERALEGGVLWFW
jgi:cell division protease FtsH